MMIKKGYVYFMTNKNKSVLYIGVTSDLCHRIYEHKNHLIKGSFTDRYNLEFCVYFEEYPFIDLAINREKELKKWSRKKKEKLLEAKNPNWQILATENGFVRGDTKFAHLVNDLFEDLKHENKNFPSSEIENANDKQLPTNKKKDQSSKKQSSPNDQESTSSGTQNH
jgi:putative endonuclease